MNPLIRPYESQDLDALYDVCVRTAADGDDLTGQIGDPRLPGHLYAGPYGVLEPEMAFVVEDADGVCGYVVGTADTAAFEQRCEADWFPALRDRYPEGSGSGALDNVMIGQLHRPPTQDPVLAAQFPAHLHIDLLPRVQGLGLGRVLIDRFTAAAQSAGAGGVHFGVSPTNHRALAFYGHLGFEPLRTDATSVVLGRRLE